MVHCYYLRILLLFFVNIINQVHSSVIYTIIITRDAGYHAPWELTENVVDPSVYQEGGIWSDGIGQLTNEGKLQMYKTGQMIRSWYPHLLSNQYSPNEVYVYCSDLDRLLVSSACLANGMYPAQGSSVWSTDLSLAKWTVIPIHTTSLSTDTMLNPKNNCPLKELELNRVYYSPLNAQLRKNLNDCTKKVSQWIKSPCNDLMCLRKLADTLLVSLWYEVELPSWANLDTLHYLDSVIYQAIKASISTTLLRRLQCGVFFKQIIDLLISKSQGKITQNIYIYTVVAFFIVAITDALEISSLYAFSKPSAALFIELYSQDTSNQSSANGLFINLKYMDSLEEPPRLIPIPNCNQPCSLAQFVRLLQKYAVTSNQWKTECFSGGFLNFTSKLDS